MPSLVIWLPLSTLTTTGEMVRVTERPLPAPISTATFVLPGTDLIFVVVGFGGVVSQLAVWPESGAVLLQAA
ncbi:MAG: hypothetical protein WBF99_14795 [Xanthobacteraceae bacterium]